MTVAAATLMGSVLTAGAQENYPTKPIRLIVPEVVGSAADLMSRIIGQRIGEALGQPVTFENIFLEAGVEKAIKAAPDGYTLMYGSSGNVALLPHVKKVSFDPLKDLTPVGRFVIQPTLIASNPALPVNTLQELVAMIKANPGKMKASGTGQGGIWHLAIAGLLKDQGIDPNALPWVPSNGAAPGMQDMIAGGVDVVPCSIPEARPMIDAGKARALAIMDDNPPALYPNVPTLKKELGTDWKIAAWRVIAAPKGIPADAQKTLGAALKRVYDSKDYKEFMASRGFGVVWADAEGTTKFMAASDANLGGALKAVGLAK